MASGGVIQYLLRVRDEASDQLDRAGDAANELGISFDGLQEAALASSAALVGLALAMNEVIASTTEAVLEIDRLSERTGVSNESIAGMQLALQSVGLEAGDVAGILEPLAERMADAAMGGEDAAKGFARLGVEIVDADGKLRSVETVLRESIDALGQIENPTERAAAGMFSIGEAGATLTSALNGSSASLDRFIDQAALLGPDLSQPAVDAAKDIATAYAQLDVTFQGIGQRISESIGQAFGGDTATLIGAFRISIEVLVGLFEQATTIVSNFFQLAGRQFIDIGKIAIFATSLQFDAAADIYDAYLRDTAKNTEAIAAATSRNVFAEVEALEQQLQATTQSMILSTDQLLAGATIEPVIRPQVAQDLFAAEGVEEPAAQATATAVEDQTSAFLAGLQALGADVTSGLDSLTAALSDALAAPFDRITAGINVLSGDISAQLALLTNIGDTLPGVAGAIAGAVSAVADFGARLESEGAAQVAEDTFKVLENIAAFFENLPEFLAEIPAAFSKAVSRLITSIPGFLIGLVQRLPEAITNGIIGNAEFFESLFQAIIELVIDLPFAIARAILIDLPRAIGNAIRDIFTFGDNGGIGGFFESIGDRLRDLGSDIRSFYGGSRQSGGFVDRTGMYLLHQGEYIAPSNGAAPTSAAAAMSGGPAVSVSVQAAVVDPDIERRLVERIRNSLSSYGRGFSLTPVI